MLYRTRIISDMFMLYRKDIISEIFMLYPSHIGDICVISDKYYIGHIYVV
jgi:hypothetical protein